MHIVSYKDLNLVFWVRRQWINYFEALIIHIAIKNNHSKAHVNFDIIRSDQTAQSELEII